MKKKGICGICPHKCPVLVTIEKERIVKVEADVEHPEGRVCPRGAMASDIIYSETRITKPLIRVGKREKVYLENRVGKRHYNLQVKVF